MTLLPSDLRIETERLLLRRIEPADLPFYSRIHADPDVARYLGHGRPRTAEESRAWLDGMLQSYRDLALGQLAITRKSDGALLGRCGLSHLETELDASADGMRVGYYFPIRPPEGVRTLTELELGYTLDQAAWGKGYAREAVAGVWKHTRERRPGQRVVSLIHPDNARSLRLASDFGVALADRVSLWERPFDRYVWPTPD